MSERRITAEGRKQIIEKSLKGYWSKISLQCFLSGIVLYGELLINSIELLT